MARVKAEERLENVSLNTSGCTHPRHQRTSTMPESKKGEPTYVPKDPSDISAMLWAT